MKRKLIGSVALLGLVFAGLVNAKPIEAVASFTVLADMVHQVGGDHVHVSSLVGKNGDPHTYEPTPDAARALKNADVVFVNGLNLEGWMDRLIQASGYQGQPVILTDGITLRMRVKHGKRGADPHAWNSVRNAQVYVHNIMDALIKIDPEHESLYRTNGEQYLERLKAVDAYTKEQIASVPEARRKVLTSHGAYGYFADDYGVAFLSPLGLSTESEASAKDVATLIEQMRKENVHAYFIENSNDPRLVQQIAKATGAQPGGELYVESLSDADGPAPTYETMFRHNVDTMVKAMKQD
ncbi:metal ABC transporter substrate-binding protein [Pseudomonas sp. Marseille-QA0892]